MLRIAATDLDGTLAHGLTVPAGNLRALALLGEHGVQRVVATGRNLYAARKLLSPDFPIDYLVFSSGAGVFDWKRQELLHQVHLPAADVARLIECLLRLELPFMVHEPIPDNHHFRYHAAASAGADFWQRCRNQAAFCQPWNPALLLERASQFLVIESERDHDEFHAHLRAELAGFNVIRATSPIDGESFWAEIFPQAVSKASGFQFLAERLGAKAEDTLAVGNDYNDIDLLAFVGHGYVVANAPASLKAQFANVADVAEEGFAEAVARWMKTF